MADLTPEQSIERKPKAFIEDCTPEEQAAFFALLYHEPPEVEGFQASQTPSFDLFAHLSGILEAQNDTAKQISANIR